MLAPFMIHENNSNNHSCCKIKNISVKVFLIPKNISYDPSWLFDFVRFVLSIYWHINSSWVI